MNELCQRTGRLPFNSVEIQHSINFDTIDGLLWDPSLAPVFYAAVIMSFPILNRIMPKRGGCIGCRAIRKAVQEFESRGAENITAQCIPRLATDKPRFTVTIDVSDLGRRVPDMTSWGGNCELADTLFNLSLPDMNNILEE